MHFGSRMLFGPKIAETGSMGPSLAHASFGPLELVSVARARFGPLELVSAISIEAKCHSHLHSSGKKLRLAEVLIFTFFMVKYNFYFVSGKIF
jgi:hypothetical protein